MLLFSKTKGISEFYVFRNIWSHLSTTIVSAKIAFGVGGAGCWMRPEGNL